MVSPVVPIFLPLHRGWWPPWDADVPWAPCHPAGGAVPGVYALPLRAAGTDTVYYTTPPRVEPGASLAARRHRSHRPNRRRYPPANPPVAGCSGGAAIKKRRVGPASRLTHAAPFHADVVTVLRGSAAASLGRLLPCPQRVKKCYSQRHAHRCTSPRLAAAAPVAGGSATSDSLYARRCQCDHRNNFLEVGRRCRRDQLAGSTWAGA